MGIEDFSWGACCLGKLAVAQITFCDMGVSTSFGEENVWNVFGYEKRLGIPQ
jgi:hypothetical protein